VADRANRFEWPQPIRVQFRHVDKHRAKPRAASELQPISARLSDWKQKRPIGAHALIPSPRSAPASCRLRRSKWLRCLVRCACRQLFGGPVDPADKCDPASTLNAKARRGESHQRANASAEDGCAERRLDKLWFAARGSLATTTRNFPRLNKLLARLGKYWSAPPTLSEEKRSRVDRFLSAMQLMGAKQ
jgi:hypothetical protein